MKTLQIITLSVRIDESLLQLVSIRGIGQSSLNLSVKTKKKNVEIVSLQISCDLSLANCFTSISVLKQILAPVGNLSVSAR